MMMFSVFALKDLKLMSMSQHLLRKIGCLAQFLLLCLPPDPMSWSTEHFGGTSELSQKVKYSVQSTAQSCDINKM